MRWVSKKWAIPELPCASVSKQVLVQNLSYENEFDLHKKEPKGQTHFKGALSRSFEIF